MPTISDVFVDGPTRLVFETIGNLKQADHKTIREKTGLGEEHTTAILEQLTKAGMVEMVKGPTPVPDFDTYFQSAKGLAASRQLERVNQMLKRAL
jgi:hypothetical protein